MPIIFSKEKTEGQTIMDSVREKATNIMEDIGVRWYTNQKETER